MTEQTTLGSQSQQSDDRQRRLRHPRDHLLHRSARPPGGRLRPRPARRHRVLSATTASKQPKEQFDFFPLTVDVEERMYAAGRIPGSFFRREGRPSEDAILTCRLIDRPLRPSFVKGLRNEVQVVATVLALDPQHPYDVVAINAASHVHQAVRPAVHRPDRRHPDGARRGPVGGLPDQRGAGAGHLRHGRRRPGAARRRSRDHDGRGGGHRAHRRAGRRRCDRARPRRSWPAAWRRPSPRSASCAGPRRELAAVAAKPATEFPVFLDYQDDAYAAVEAAAARRGRRGAEDRRQGRARGGAGPDQEAVFEPSSRRSSRAGRRRSAPRSGR